MLINMRNAMMAGKRLPYDAEVEYLESTGTQWIDTGVYVTADCLFDFAVAKTRSRYNCVFFGVRNSGNVSSNNLQCFLNSNDTISNTEYPRIKLYTTSTEDTSCWNSGVVPVINQMYAFTGAYCVPTMQTSTQTMPLFAFKNVNTFNTANCACRIGHWKVYTQSAVFRDMIPVRFTNELGQSEGAMYDRANPTVGMDPDGSARTDGLYRNRGAGAFSYGNDL